MFSYSGRDLGINMSSDTKTQQFNQETEVEDINSQKTIKIKIQDVNLSK